MLILTLDVLRINTLATKQGRNGWELGKDTTPAGKTRYRSMC